MRYLKRHNTNRRLLRGKGIVFDQYENIEVQSTGTLQVPKGTTLERPPLPVVGQLRYNTTTKNFEVYEDVAAGGTMLKSFRLRIISTPLPSPAARITGYPPNVQTSTMPSKTT